VRAARAALSRQARNPPRNEHRDRGYEEYASAATDLVACHPEGAAS